MPRDSAESLHKLRELAAMFIREDPQIGPRVNRPATLLFRQLGVDVITYDPRINLAEFFDHEATFNCFLNAASLMNVLQAPNAMSIKVHLLDTFRPYEQVDDKVIRSSGARISSLEYQEHRPALIRAMTQAIIAYQQTYLTAIQTHEIAEPRHVESASRGRKTDLLSHKQQIHTAFDKMIAQDKVSFKRGGLAAVVEELAPLFPTYKSDSIRRIIHPAFKAHIAVSRTK